MSAAAVILYEDASGPRKGFGPHELVLRCVADDYVAPQAFGSSRHYTLSRRLDGRPMKGVDKVLNGCENIERIVDGGQRLFILVDNDRIRRHVRLPSAASSEEVQAAIRALCPLPNQLHITLLEDNAESLIKAAADCDPNIDRVRVAEALRKKLMSRDLVFESVARGQRRDVRDCVRQCVPSFDGFIRALVAWLQSTEPRAPDEAHSVT